MPFTSGPNKFEALAAMTPWCLPTAPSNTVAASLFKIANDIRLLGSGPRFRPGRVGAAGKRAGLLHHAGKVNPTQCEALTQVCVQIFGNNAALTFCRIARSL